MNSVESQFIVSFEGTQHLKAVILFAVFFL